MVLNFHKKQKEGGGIFYFQILKILKNKKWNIFKDLVNNPF